ncbi:serine hydrolase domain-containing protein [Carboxylicivirga marina]|uniref:serine hydrolase domain-containing protein n=1 Tax=Carboxylicivirga marina TaxID=2800988 RepID=UPI0025996C19|nr:serine hydrolase [uncultured Carboxylicivirga sp.]
MKGFKQFLKWFVLTMVVIFITMGFMLYPLLRGATGYSAKMLCSGVFVEGLSQQKVEQRELTAFPFNKVVNTIDYKAKTVKSTILGFVLQTAAYKDEVGATLYTDGYSEINGRVALPGINNDTLPWPQGNAITDTLPAGIDIVGLERFIDQKFEKTTRALVVVKDGQLITEKYADGIDEFTPLLGWSMTKSITAALTGILVKEGKLAIDDAALLEEWKDDERNNITLNNLLQMSSGLAWNEDYSKTSLSDVSEMLYTKGDMYQYASAFKLESLPDSVWRYSSGTTNIISGLIRSCFDDYQSYYQFPQKALFNKIGMQNSIIETDAAGTFVGSSYAYCSARDWARFGMLYLNNGNWLGEQILPEWWVKYSTTPASSSLGKYGAQVWLNASQINIPDMPADVYFFNGYRGQRVTIIPSKNMVVVGLNSSAEEFDYNSLLSGMMQFFK